MVESTGEYCYKRGDRVSKEEAKDYALMDARANALEKAYGRNVTVFESLSKKPSKKEDYYVLSTSQINGAVQILENNFEYSRKSVKVNVKALVSKTNTDSFIKVNGIQSMYRLMDPIMFKIVFYENGYLYVFGLSKDWKGVQLYPNDQENVRNYYTKGESQLFPTKRHVSYRPVRRSNSGQKDPYNFYLCPSGDYNKTMTLFFVFLKSEHPYKENEVTYNNIMKWYMNVPEEDKNGMEVKTFIAVE